MKLLISELNEVLRSGPFDASKLKKSAAVWEFLPEVIQEQLLVDREATGYIQVAKIATERLLILLVEAELSKHFHDIPMLMPHYFGYEGRCAMPSNFDANYCYALGCTAGILIQKGKNGYMSTLRYLEQHPSMWQAFGVPFTSMMSVKEDKRNNTWFPGVKRSLVTTKGQLFSVFESVRKQWRFNDLYRAPGPIQFDGPTADQSNYAVNIPGPEELLYGASANGLVCSQRAVFKKYLGCMSPVQVYRKSYTPKCPPLCADLKARATRGNQYFSDDPYTQRQILIHYPYMTSDNHFYLQEVVHDKYTPPISVGLRVGIVFISRQSPGVMNIVWGLHKRLQLVGGTLITFFGLKGLLEKQYIEPTDDDLQLFLNQGGNELLGRATSHCLNDVEQQQNAFQVCKSLMLDGLIIPGSAFSMTEAALLSEYFLSHGSRTSVIGIPATGSNNICHDLIECCLGFDSSTKVYASLIGNVLTDAASMPKYWHFVRLMGRQPSHEVLECALQTHPNVVIIAEEYGEADKTLLDVVHDIAEVVCKRAEMGKNFGTILIPDALLLHLPNMKILLSEISAILRTASHEGKLKDAQKELVSLESLDGQKGEFSAKLTPWSLELLKTFPKFIRKELVDVDMGEMKFERLETEELLAQMVKKELEHKRAMGLYSGKFQAVTHFFGYQGRSSLPSCFDSNLAYSYGHLACILVESGLTGYCCTIRGLCGDVSEWKLGALPFLSIMKMVHSIDDSHVQNSSGVHRISSKKPIIPSAHVSLHGNAYRWLKTAQEKWSYQDRFCNPGPMQFDGLARDFYNRVLFEEQAEYFDMLRRVEVYTDLLKDTCRFGISEEFLKTAYVSLTGLLTLAYHPHDVTSRLPTVMDMKKYNEGKQNEGVRPRIYLSNDNTGSRCVHPCLPCDNPLGRSSTFQRGGLSSNRF